MMFMQTAEADTYTWRDRHFGRLLLELSKDFQSRSIEQLRELGYDDITFAYISVIAATSVDGTRLTDIAKSLDISKQAAGQMVKELIGKGYLTRQADPSDGRATLVTFTEKGRKLLIDGKEGIDGIEALYAQLISEERFTALRDVLALLLERTREQSQDEL